MNRHARSCPLAREQLLDRYFLEHRGKLVDIAAFLDRLDRAADEPVAADQPKSDPRLAGLRAALAILSDGAPERTARVLETLSDPTRTPVTDPESKGAIGAYPLSDKPARVRNTRSGGSR